jgi:hypothetical protein
MRSLLPGIDSDFFSKGLFRGRLAQNYNFLKGQGVDPRRYSGFIEAQDFLWQWIYRLYNREMRRKTNSLWEPMHGISSSKQDFNNIIFKLTNV